MDADGDGLVSPFEFMCRTLVAQVSFFFQNNKLDQRLTLVGPQSVLGANHLELNWFVPKSGLRY